MLPSPNSSSNLHYRKVNITVFLIRLACLFVQMLCNFVIIFTIYPDLDPLLPSCVGGFRFLYVQPWSRNMWCPRALNARFESNVGNEWNKFAAYFNPPHEVCSVWKQCIKFSTEFFLKRKILRTRMQYISLSNIVLMLFNTPFSKIPKGFSTSCYQNLYTLSRAPRTFQNKMDSPEVEDNTTLIQAKCFISISEWNAFPSVPYTLPLYLDHSSRCQPAQPPTKKNPKRLPIFGCSQFHSNLFN